MLPESVQTLAEDLPPQWLRRGLSPQRVDIRALSHISAYERATDCELRFRSRLTVLWTDLSGAHLIAYCGTTGVVNGTHLTPVHLHVPDAYGTDFNGALLW
jgi:hypothetical protein